MVGLGLCGVEGRTLIELRVSLGWSSGGRDQRRLVGQLEFMKHYFSQGGDRHQLVASPLFADDFTDLPQAYILTAG